MKRGLGLAVLVAIAPTEPVAEACSCMGPEGARLIVPLRVEDAALNTHVHLAVVRQKGAPDPIIEIRSAHDQLVATRATYTSTEGSWTDHLELVPSAALAPGEDYVVSWRTPDRYPDTRVLGRFHTGTSADTTPPRLAPLGPPSAPTGRLRSSCDTGRPWVRFETEVDDPGHRRDRFLFAVWLVGAGAKLDANAPPTAVIEAHDQILTIGRSSSCSPQDFPFPKTSSAWLGIAALDEAGNRSAIQNVRVPVLAERP